MSRLEIFITVLLCFVPILAVIIIPNKKKAKKGKQAQPAKTEKEPPKEQPKESPKEEAKEETKPTETKQTDEELKQAPKEDFDGMDLYTEDSFKAYLNDKLSKHPGPKKKDGDLNSTGFYDPFLFNKPQATMPPPKEEPKTVSEEIENISPELRTLLLSGALKPKYFDEEDK